MNWIKAELVEGVDYGRIHVVKRDKCPHGKHCTNPHHFSKDTLYKSGAEKIAGMMGFRSVWPMLAEYERRMLEGGAIQQVGLRCQLVDKNGNVIAEGWGARSLRQDYDDLNKAVKMAKKSGLIDAVLNAGGLSEVFTQDVEDMPPEAFDDDPQLDPYSPQQSRRMDVNAQINIETHCPIGKHRGDPWAEVPLDYLEWVLANLSNMEPGLVKRIERETADRLLGPDSTAAKFATKIEAGTAAVQEMEADQDRIARVNNMPLKHFADLIAAALGMVELDSIEKDIAGTLHEKPLQAFLQERKAKFN